MMDANPHHNLNPYLNLAALMPPGRNPPSVAELIQIQNQIRMAALIGQQMLPPSQHPLLTAPPAFPTLHPAQYPFSPQLPPSFNEHILNWARASSATGASVDGMGDQRRGRQTYTRYQTAALEKEFSMHTYLSRARRIVISDMLNLSERQIKIWFQNRRMKHKREQQGAASVSGVDKSPTHKKPSIPGLSPTDDHRAECKERTTDPNSNVIDSEVNKSSHSPSSETGKVEEKPNKECDDSISMDSDGELILEQIDKKNQH